jgi:Transposase DDE domain
MSGIDRCVVDLEEKVIPVAVHPIRRILTSERIEEWCLRAGHVWRARVFDPTVTLMACLVKHLCGNSARQIEHDSIPGSRIGLSAPDGADFCQARRRLPLSVFQKAVRFLAHNAEQQALELWRGRQVLFVDGTTTPLPRTKENGDIFGFAPNQRGRSVLPVVRILLLVSAATGAALDSVCAPYRFGELRMLRVLFSRLSGPAVLIGDALFSAYWVLAMSAQRDCHFICPPQQQRGLHAPLKRLGWRDELYQWSRPVYMPKGFPPHLWNRVPEVLTVRVIRRVLRRRGYRDRTLVLCTTLLDPKAWPAAEIFAQYLRRWNIELDIRTLKNEHGLARLGTKTPPTVMREIQSALLAHNTVRYLMSASGRPARRLSHTQSLELINATACAMRYAPPRRLIDLNQMLLLQISTSVLAQYARPPEPRAVIHRGKPYRLLRSSRSEWRNRQRQPA